MNKKILEAMKKLLIILTFAVLIYAFCWLGGVTFNSLLIDSPYSDTWGAKVVNFIFPIP
jgi:hypothetical protein